VQLAAYRLGWSRLTGVPVERVSAGFHHVAAGVTVRPVDLLDEAGLLALVTGRAAHVDDDRPSAPSRTTTCRPSRTTTCPGGPDSVDAATSLTVWPSRSGT
jgi:DNA helicase-2/ATP-dependent DNA helicase PcrA